MSAASAIYIRKLIMHEKRHFPHDLEIYTSLLYLHFQIIDALNMDSLVQSHLESLSSLFFLYLILHDPRRPHEISHPNHVTVTSLPGE